MHMRSHGSTEFNTWNQMPESCSLQSQGPTSGLVLPVAMVMQLFVRGYETRHKSSGERVRQKDWTSWWQATELVS